MKNNEENIMNAFEGIRKSPTELSLTEIERFIQTIPDTLEYQRHNNTDTFFNLKSILMWTIPLSLVIGLFLFIGDPVLEQDHHLSSLDIETKPQQIDLNESNYAIVLQTDEKNTEKPVLSDEPASMNSTELFKIKNRTTSGVINTEQRTIEKITLPESRTMEINEKRELTWIKRRAVSDKAETEPVPMSDFSNRALRKLKKKLFKELESDGIIPFSPMALEISLLGTSIMVNHVTIEDKYFIKYAELTSKAGSGPDRMIKINHDYILVGDFAEEGFSGHGLGTFQGVEMNSPDSPLFGSSLENNPELLIKQQMNERDLFAETIVNDVGPLLGAKRKGGVDLDYNKCRTLHKELYELLIHDQLIKDAEQYVVIQVPDAGVLINGQPLNQSLLQIYIDLFASYKIKSGAYRMIRLSEHTISVGDYIGGSFSGTTTTIEK